MEEKEDAFTQKFQEELIDLKEQIEKFKQQMRSEKAKFDAIFKRCEGMVQHVRKKIDSHDKTLLEVKKENIRHTQFLEKILKSHEILDKTVCNVLLAIRQNEYLQAWYPAQKGIQEMQVVGLHPLEEVS